MNKRPVTAVLGLGNVIQSDDGIGVKAVECLREIKYLPIDVKLIDGGPLGLELVSYLGGVQRLIVIDAIDLGNEPGTIARLGGEDLREVSGASDVHQLGVADILAALRLMGEEPEEIVILGVQPAVISLGSALSPAVESRLPALVEIVLCEVMRQSRSTIGH